MFFRKLKEKNEMFEEKNEQYLHEMIRYKVAAEMLKDGILHAMIYLRRIDDNSYDYVHGIERLKNAWNLMDDVKPFKTWNEMLEYLDNLYPQL